MSGIYLDREYRRSGTSSSGKSGFDKGGSSGGSSDDRNTLTPDWWNTWNEQYGQYGLLGPRPVNGMPDGWTQPSYGRGVAPGTPLPPPPTYAGWTPGQNFLQGPTAIPTPAPAPAPNPAPAADASGQMQNRYRHRWGGHDGNRYFGHQWWRDRNRWGGM